MRMNQRDRTAFIYEAGREGMPIEVARKLLRYGSTLHRLAEAQCNGDWPYGNGDGTAKPCTLCEGFWRAQLVQGVCPDCRASHAVKQAVPAGWRAKVQGDPRRAVLRIVAPSGRVLVAG